MQDPVDQEANTVGALPEDVIRSTMTAMVTVIMGRNEATRADVEHYKMVWKGETLSGVSAAQQVFIESLNEYPNAWIAYLAKGENRKVATSMDVALNDDLARELVRTEQGEQVLEALRRIIDVAPVFEPEPTGEHRIIDLREEARQTEDETAPAQ